MKKFWPLMIIIPLLLMFTCTGIVGGTEEEWEVKLGDETYLITKVPEVQTNLRYIPEALDLKVVSASMETAIRSNPVSAPGYIASQVDFWFEVLKRFALTAKPIVAFAEGTYGGLEITIYEQESWCATWGKLYELEDAPLAEQPSFIGIETREIPMLSNLADIFKNLRLGGMYVNEGFCAYLSYELLEE